MVVVVLTLGSCLCETLALLLYGIQTAVYSRPQYGGLNGVEVIARGKCASSLGGTGHLQQVCVHGLFNSTVGNV